MMLCACFIYSVVCMIAYVVLGTDGAKYMSYMQYYVQMVLCTYYKCGDMYIWCSVHVVYVVLCTYGAV